MQKNKTSLLLGGVVHGVRVPPRPRDRATLSPTECAGWCELRIWNADGEIGLVVRMPARHATETFIDRAQALVQAWGLGEPAAEHYRGPRLLK